MNNNESDGGEPHFLSSEHLELFAEILSSDVDAVDDYETSHSFQEVFVHLERPDTTLLEPYTDWFDLDIESLYPVSDDGSPADEGETYRLVMTPDHEVETPGVGELRKRYAERRVIIAARNMAPIDCPDCGNTSLAFDNEVFTDEAVKWTTTTRTLTCGDCETSVTVDFSDAEVVDGDPTTVARELASDIASQPSSTTESELSFEDIR